jgi:hypothetical protein
MVGAGGVVNQDQGMGKVYTTGNAVGVCISQYWKMILLIYLFSIFKSGFVLMMMQPLGTSRPMCSEFLPYIIPTFTDWYHSNSVSHSVVNETWESNHQPVAMRSTANAKPASNQRANDDPTTFNHDMIANNYIREKFIALAGTFNLLFSNSLC